MDSFELLQLKYETDTHLVSQNSQLRPSIHFLFSFISAGVLEPIYIAVYRRVRGKPWTDLQSIAETPT